jgi:hypothetical protein
LPKRLLIAVLALLLVLGTGWLWGAFGRWEAERALEQTRLQADLIAGRSLLLDARLELYNVNFGNASRHLEEARQLLRGVSEDLEARGLDEQIKTLELALMTIDQAHSLAGKLDPAANSRAADAARLIAEILQGVGTP